MVKKYDLGYIRLWQDELAEIIRLIRQLPYIEDSIEADNNRLTDVRTDLPQLESQRISYFIIKAQRFPGLPEDVMNVKLTRNECIIEATEPDLATMGVIESIRSLAGANRRLPAWAMPLYRAAPTKYQLSGDNVIISGSTINPLTLIIIVLAFIFGVIFGIGAVQHLVHAHGTPFVSWPTSIITAIPLLVVAAALMIGWTRARTLMFTGTRKDAPTFWQRKRSDIAINVIVGIALYLLGLLTAHL